MLEAAEVRSSYQPRLASQYQMTHEKRLAWYVVSGKRETWSGAPNPYFPGMCSTKTLGSVCYVLWRSLPKEPMIIEGFCIMDRY